MAVELGGREVPAGLELRQHVERRLEPVRVLGVAGDAEERRQAEDRRCGEEVLRVEVVVRGEGAAGPGVEQEVGGLPDVLRAGVHELRHVGRAALVLRGGRVEKSGDPDAECKDDDGPDRYNGALAMAMLALISNLKGNGNTGRIHGEKPGAEIRP